MSNKKRKLEETKNRKIEEESQFRNFQTIARKWPGKLIDLLIKHHFQVESQYFLDYHRELNFLHEWSVSAYWKKMIKKQQVLGGLNWKNFNDEISKFLSDDNHQWSVQHDLWMRSVLSKEWEKNYWKHIRDYCLWNLKFINRFPKLLVQVNHAQCIDLQSSNNGRQTTYAWTQILENPFLKKKYLHWRCASLKIRFLRPLQVFILDTQAEKFKESKVCYKPLLRQGSPNRRSENKTSQKMMPFYMSEIPCFIANNQSFEASTWKPENWTAELFQKGDLWKTRGEIQISVLSYQTERFFICCIWERQFCPFWICGT